MEFLGILINFKIIVLLLALLAYLMQTIFDTENATSAAKFSHFVLVWIGLIFGWFFLYKFWFSIVPITQEIIAFEIPWPSTHFLTWILSTGFFGGLLWLLNDDRLGQRNKFSNFFIMAFIISIFWYSYFKLWFSG